MYLQKVVDLWHLVALLALLPPAARRSTVQTCTQGTECKGGGSAALSCAGLQETV